MKNFEAIGFVPFFKTKDLIIYENFPDNEKERINVVFYLKIKQIRVYYVENDEDVFIDMPLLKAINKQCEELGWLDKLTIMYKLIEKEKNGEAFTHHLFKKRKQIHRSLSKMPSNSKSKNELLLFLWKTFGLD